MIINNTFFVNEFYIPHARPSITSDVTTVDAEIDVFIRRYVKECLVKCFGVSMANEFVSNLNLVQTNLDNLMKVGAGQKWINLMYGWEYTDADGEQKVWRGLIFKEFGSDVYFSYLTAYVFWKYEQNADTFRGGAGNAVAQVKNATVISANSKVTKAFRDFVDFVQGSEVTPSITSKNGLIGLDWYQGGASQEVSLYRYILDQNELGGDDVEVSFSNFRGMAWYKPNQYGI